MNAPAKPEATATETRLPRKTLLPSKTNPRTRRGLDAASLAELAASIKDMSILQPLLVRPEKSAKPTGDYEIVCGERRWRAAEIAGLADVPVRILDLTDEQVLKMQLTENVQREDLDELEEAEGYEKLMKQADSEGRPYTADRIAEFMGVSRATIYARLKLLALCDKARDAFYEDKIDASTALLIARISPEKIQLEALHEITRNEMSYRSAHDLIQRKYMLELKQAVFDIKDAVLVKKVGACTDCPKRTGNQPDLFADVKSKDVCTDPVCYAMKKAAQFLIIRNKAEAEGAKIITGQEAKKLIPYSHVSNYTLQEKGYALSNSPIPNDPQGRTWEQALKQTKLLDAKDGKKAVQPTIIENPHSKGEIIQAINIEQAAKALREQGYEVSLRGQSNRPVKSEKEKAEDAKLKAQTKAENLYRANLIQTIHAKAELDLLCDTPQLRPEVFRVLAKDVFSNSKSYAARKQMVIAHLGEKAEKITSDHERNSAFMEHMDTLTPPQCMLIMIDLIMSTEEKVEDWQVRNKDVPDTLLALAAMHEIDSASIKKQAEQEIKAAADAKKRAKVETKPKAPAKPAAKKVAAAVPATTPAAPASDKGTAAVKPIRPATEWPFPTPGRQA